MSKKGPTKADRRLAEMAAGPDRAITCSASGCEDNELFEIGITVYSNRDVAENLRKIPAEQFTCSNCGGRAVLETSP